MAGCGKLEWGLDAPDRRVIMDTQSLAATHPRSAPEWLPRVLRQLEAMRQVPENWDGYHAAAPRLEMIDAASRFIQCLVERFPVVKPYVTPTRVGGVLFAWEC